MEKRTMERRDFLKRTGSFFLGMMCLPFARLFREKKNTVARPASTREAMHYTSGDNLAG